MQAFSQGQHEFLGSLLNVVIVKLRYDDETEWDADDDEPEEEALFFEMRKVRESSDKRWIMRLNFAIFI
jgi:exportin-T